MDPNITKALNDKLYDKRKSGALELEALIREALKAQDHDRIAKIVHELCHHYAYAVHQPHARNAVRQFFLQPDLGARRHRDQRLRAVRGHSGCGRGKEKSGGQGRHSGMLSCFFQGLDSCLLRSEAKARATRLRVEWGWITSSMKPFSAATKGLAKRSS